MPLNFLGPLLLLLQLSGLTLAFVMFSFASIKSAFFRHSIVGQSSHFSMNAPSFLTDLRLWSSLVNSTPSESHDENSTPASPPSSPSVTTHIHNSLTSSASENRAFWDNFLSSSPSIQEIPSPQLSEAPVDMPTPVFATARPRNTHVPEQSHHTYPVRELVRPNPGLTDAEVNCDHWASLGSFSSMDSLSSLSSMESITIISNNIAYPEHIPSEIFHQTLLQSYETALTFSASIASAPHHYKEPLDKFPRDDNWNTIYYRVALSPFVEDIQEGSEEDADSGDDLTFSFEHNNITYYITDKSLGEYNGQVARGWTSSQEEIGIQIHEKAIDDVGIQVVSLLQQRQCAFVYLPDVVFEDAKYVYAARQTHSQDLLQSLRPTGQIYAPLNAWQVRVYMAELSLALAHLAELDIVHCDIRPENISIASDGHVALSSFAYAAFHKGLGAPQLKTRYPATGFLAPEMVSTHMEIDGYDGKVDVWGFGMTLLDLLTGQVHVASSTQPELEQYNIMMPFVIHNLIDAFVEDEAAADLLHAILQEKPASRPSLHEFQGHRFFQDILEYRHSVETHATYALSADAYSPIK